jgi:7,8-dihydro-6-hydroxymethylpterin dimethyltransferase
MTFPVFFDILGWHLHAHQVIEVLAYGAGFRLYLHLRRRWPSGPPMTLEQTGWVMIGAIFGALIGARSLAWLESYPFYWAHRADWRVLMGGKTIVGALLGGWTGVEIVKRQLRIGHPSGDVYVFPLLLGMAIGRVGCFLEGLGDHTYGIATSLPWGVDFGDGVLRHPTQLYEIVFLMGFAAFFLWRIRTRRQHGCMFSQFLLGYLAWRFLVEFIKPRDLVPGLPFSAIQWVSLLGITFVSRHLNDTCCGREHAAQPSPSAGEPPVEERFTELTNSLCPHCLRKVEAKVLVGPQGVFLQKFCPEHGSQRVMIAHDPVYWQESRALYKPPTPPLHRNTNMQTGCPHDCGLCPDHEQHSCLAILEITEQCQLGCPVCYADSSKEKTHRSLTQIEHMLDAAMANEGELNVLQISGGEPTLHPELIAILDAAKARPIRHLMLNTNGLRIAEDEAFADQLAIYRPGFEVYLQFDSLRPESLQRLRGRDLSALRRKAVEILNERDISTTLVMTVAKGINDEEMGEVLEFALSKPCVRGVTFQPIQVAGRLQGFSGESERLTLTEVRSALLRQQDRFKAQDVLPVPCHAESLAMGYALRHGQALLPLSTLIDPRRMLELGGNTISYEQDPKLREQLLRLFSLSATSASAAGEFQKLCCPPGLDPGSINYRQIFRVIIMQFMDAWTMDLRSLKRSCVHIIHPDGRLIPFETYNLLHRNSAHSLS